MVQFCNACAHEEGYVLIVIKLLKAIPHKTFWLLWYIDNHTVIWRTCDDICMTESCDGESDYLFTPTALLATSKKEVYIIGNGLLFR